MDRYILGFAALTAVVFGFTGPAEARRGIWIPTSGTGLAVFIGIIVILLLIAGAIKLMRMGTKVAIDQSTLISREAGLVAREAIEARENSPSAWADRLGAEIEQRAAERGRAVSSPTASRAAAPAARPVRTAALSTGPRSSFGKR